MSSASVRARDTALKVNWPGEVKPGKPASLFQRVLTSLMCFGLEGAWCHLAGLGERESSLRGGSLGAPGWVQWGLWACPWGEIRSAPAANRDV